MRECNKCRALTTNRTYCGPCKAVLNYQSRVRCLQGKAVRAWHRNGALDCSKPPPPPPGFDERDRVNGKPLA